MKINVAGLGIGLGIGVAIGIGVSALFLVSFLQPKIESRGQNLVIGGYLSDISETSVSISQNLQGKIDNPVVKDCTDYCGENVIRAKVTYETSIHGCSVEDGLDVKSCIDKLGKNPIDEKVCSYLRLVNGQLYAGHMFLNQNCDTKPQIPNYTS